MTAVKVGIHALLLLSFLSVGCGGGALDAAWLDETGDSVGSERLLAMAGPREHCGWSSATFLFVGRADSVPGIPDEFYDQFVRDPEDLFSDLLADTYRSDVELPDDAVATEYISADGAKIWIAPSTTSSIFIEIDDRIEKWPRVKTDAPLLCN